MNGNSTEILKFPKMNFDFLKAEYAEAINKINDIIRDSITKAISNLRVIETYTYIKPLEGIRSLTSILKKNSDKLLRYKATRIGSDFINRKLNYLNCFFDKNKPIPSTKFSFELKGNVKRHLDTDKDISKASLSELIRYYVEVYFSEFVKDLAKKTVGFFEAITKKFYKYTRKKCLKGQSTISSLQLFKERYINDIIILKYIDTTFVYEAFPGVL